MKITKQQTEKLLAMGYSQMIIDTLNAEQINNALKVSIKRSSGKGSKILDGIADYFKTLLGEEKSLKVAFNDVAEKIGIIQLYNYFESFTLNGVVMQPTSKIDVKFLCKDGEVVLTEKLDKNARLEGVKVGRTMIAYDIWDARGRAVVNSHLLKDKENSQFNKNSYGFTVSAIDKNTIEVVKDDK